MTYHFNLRIIRWPLTFQTSAEKNMLYSTCYEYKHTVLLDLRTSNMLISVLPTIDQLISKTCRLEGNQRTLKTKRYTESTLFRDGERFSMQQFTHPVHPKRSIAFRTCFGGKKEKYDRQQKNTSGKNKQEKTVYRQNISFQKKGIASQRSPSIELLVLVG